MILKSGGVHLKRNEVNRCDRRRRFKRLKLMDEKMAKAVELNNTR